MIWAETFLLGSRRKIAKCLMKTFTWRSTFLYDKNPSNILLFWLLMNCLLLKTTPFPGENGGGDDESVHHKVQGRHENGEQLHAHYSIYVFFTLQKLMCCLQCQLFSCVKSKIRKDRGYFRSSLFKRQNLGKRSLLLR